MFSSIYLGAATDEFSEAANAIQSASDSGKSILGAVFGWGFSVVLPLVAMVVGIILGYKFQSKRAEQDQSTLKLFVILGGCAVAGFFVYVIIAMLFSRALLGDFSAILTKVYAFWNSVQW
ncbi:hypothetical protein FQW77_08605 [Campylobacter jejuni]|nr:hypothetical protein [Campylobacter jejuni]